MSAPRNASPTVRFVDEYCALYRDLFPEVRSFEAFKFLHLGMISEIKRKSLPAIAKVVGLSNEQNLHHFLTESPWTAQQLCHQRLKLTLEVLKGRSVTLLIDETGDCKKGNRTDYVKRQYIGNVGKKENGIVAVTAYGLVDGMILPLCFQVYKPQERLQPGDVYQSRPQIAATMIRGLQEMGFRFDLVLADSLYGESKINFVNVLDDLKLPYILAIRSNHGMWLPAETEVSQTPWQTFERTFSNGKTEQRYMAEVIYGQRQRKQYWILTTNPQTLPENATSFVMVNAPTVKLTEIGNQYGFRAWIEYGLKQAKDVLGWADFRVTHYAQIEKWWEIVMSAFLMVSLFADPFNQAFPLSHQQFAKHVWWNAQSGWKHWLNNLRLIIQPLIAFNTLKPWLEIFPLPSLSDGLALLAQNMQHFCCPAVLELTPPVPISSA